jgi:DnaJ-class molecular chaperone
MPGHENYYDLLGVSRTSDAVVIRAAYRALMTKYHPDKFPDARHADEMAKRLNEAFAVLGDPEKCARYDEGLQPKTAPFETWASQPVAASTVEPDPATIITKKIRPSSAGYLLLFILAQPAKPEGFRF